MTIVPVEDQFVSEFFVCNVVDEEGVVSFFFLRNKIYQAVKLNLKTC